jgi:hypothetical protein
MPSEADSLNNEQRYLLSDFCSKFKLKPKASSRAATHKKTTPTTPY